MKAGFDPWMYSLGSVPPWVKLLQVSKLRIFNCNEAPKKSFYILNKLWGWGDPGTSQWLILKWSTNTRHYQKRRLLSLVGEESKTE